VTEYAYDAVGNLRAVTLPNGDEIEYLVDGQGRRVGKTVNGVFEKGWLWRGQLQPVAELDASGAVAKRFVYGARKNAPDLMVTSTATYRLVKDHLGSVREVVDVATNAVAQKLEYDAWGRVLVDTSPGFQPFAFAGGIADHDVRTVQFGARQYESEIGRWQSRDPIRFEAGDTNLLAYAGADPVNRIDPTGLKELPTGGVMNCLNCVRIAEKTRAECYGDCNTKGDHPDNCKQWCDIHFDNAIIWCKRLWCKGGPMPTPGPKPFACGAD
jgi:RHS repeat-associated protein